MIVLLSGGGTAGHVTPIRTIAREIKQQQPQARLFFIGERRTNFSQLLEDAGIEQSRHIWAGKLRRYHGESWLKRIFDIKTITLNLRDLFLVSLGTLQAVWVVRRLKPDVVFLKGGFVGVPVGLAAALWRVPIITHDSDAVAGLANRVVSRWVNTHATALSPEYYPYDSQRTVQVGVVVASEYEQVNESLQQQYRQAIGVGEAGEVLLISPGSSGSVVINEAVRTLVPKLLEQHPNLYIVHQTGKGKAGIYQDFHHDRLFVSEFLHPLYQYSGAADVIIMRAGANSLAEFGVQAKACVVIPSPHLTGGHQLENAQRLADAKAIAFISQASIEHDAVALEQVVNQLLASPEDRRTLAKNLQKQSATDAAQIVARLIIETGANIDQATQQSSSNKQSSSCDEK